MRATKKREAKSELIVLRISKSEKTTLEAIRKRTGLTVSQILYPTLQAFLKACKPALEGDKESRDEKAETKPTNKKTRVVH